MKYSRMKKEGFIMSVLKNLKPEKVFYYFEEITKIPHGSYNTKEISDYLVNFAKEHGLDYVQDASNNVVIRKPAAPGYENAPVTIIQGHCDMVCVKTADSDHDFTKDPLQLAVDGDFIYAKDTSLGGDDGIAIAYALAILDSDDIPHPALEVVITTDEEVGLIGAGTLDKSILKGTYMLNLDSEDEGSLLVGCAGGMSAVSTIPVDYRLTSGVMVTLSLEGLLGGHSGVEINKNRGNANILMGRFLYELAEKTDYQLIDLNGGQQDNVIPKACAAHIVVDESEVAAVVEAAALYQKNLRGEYSGSDENMVMSVEANEKGEYDALIPSSKAKIIFYLMNVANGVQKMSGQIEGLVESSTNLGILRVEDGYMYAKSSTRSSVATAKRAIGDKICFLTEFLGGDYTEEGAYPGWEYNPDSKLHPLMVDVYEKMYGEKPVVEVIHAGLECGLFFECMPGLDCVSFGPDMESIHSVNEKLSISSVARTWEYLLAVLKEIK